MGQAVDLLIDTDMSIDVDDVGMLCTAHALVDLSEARILAVTHGTHLETGVGAISAINQFYNRDNIPIGAYRGIIGSDGGGLGWTHGGRGVFVDELVDKFKPRIRTYHQVPSAVDVYRRTLSSAANGSVTVVCVGHLTNLFDLLQSAADRALVAHKVRQLVIMGGRPFWGGVEWNFAGCGNHACGDYNGLGTITHDALNAWPPSVPVVYLGYEAGINVHTGLLNVARNLEESPCDHAYKSYCTQMSGWCNGGGRSSWDSMALLYGVRGDPHGYYTLQSGSTRIDAATGRTIWKANVIAEGEFLAGTQLVLNEAKAAALAHELNGLYMRLPRQVTPPEPPRQPPLAPPQPPPMQPPAPPTAAPIPPLQLPIPPPQRPSLSLPPQLPFLPPQRFSLNLSRVSIQSNGMASTSTSSIVLDTDTKPHPLTSALVGLSLLPYRELLLIGLVASLLVSVAFILLFYPNATLMERSKRRRSKKSTASRDLTVVGREDRSAKVAGYERVADTPQEQEAEEQLGLELYAEPEESVVGREDRSANGTGYERVADTPQEQEAEEQLGLYADGEVGDSPVERREDNVITDAYYL